ncbi:unnamed protein product [Brachionus calyciflorus]|uniref:RRM domain-containing protein n=1 Tax=Brachionus calyciflorus TaxID=104777 RepID=A0A814E602_9BILA|nr:unnamed protein product [Brachionus calyciflorus]
MSVNVQIDTSGGSGQHQSNNSFNPCNLIVNYLPQSVKEHDFNALFSKIGPLKSCKLMFDRQTGYSFGYGFVEYLKEEDAKKAVDTLNGYQIEHKRLKVAYARPNSDDTKNTNLYIRNIPVNYTEQQLVELFSQFGEVIQVRLLRDQNTTFSRRIGFVIMGTKQMAHLAIQNLDNTIPPNGGNEPIYVKYADDEGGKKKHHGGGGHQQFMNNRNFNNYQNSQFQNNMMQSQTSFQNMNLGKMKTNRNNGHQNRYNPMGGNNTAIIGGGNSNNPNNGNGYNPWNMGPIGGGTTPNGNNGYAHHGNMHPSMGSNGNYMNTAAAMAAAAAAAAAAAGIGNNSNTNLIDINTAGLPMDSKSNLSYNSSGLSTTTIYVYGFGPHATESDLYSLFSNIGRISRVNVIKNAKTGQSKGYGFVVFETFEEANLAVHSMNGYVYHNKPLQVQLHFDS